MDTGDKIILGIIIALLIGFVMGASLAWYAKPAAYLWEARLESNGFTVIHPDYPPEGLPVQLQSYSEFLALAHESGIKVIAIGNYPYFFKVPASDQIFFQKGNLVYFYKL